jgi:hypothetical protein
MRRPRDITDVKVRKAHAAALKELAMRTGVKIADVALCNARRRTKR